MNVHTVTTLISRAGLTAVALFALAALTAHAQSDVTPPQNTTPPVLDEAPFDPAQDSLFLDPATEDVLDPAIDPADPVLDPFADVDLATDRFIGAFPGQSGEIRTALVDFGAGPVEITYEVIEGMAVFEGDMILGSADEIAALAASGPLVWPQPFAPFGSPEGSTDDSGAADATDPANPDAAIRNHAGWPGGVIPFEIDATAFPVNSEMRKLIGDAIAHWNANTIVRLVARDSSNSSAHYLRFVSGTGCSSTIGLGSGASQTVNLHKDNCKAADVIIHEIGHAVGLFHEQARSDRDQYVNINWANIQAGKEDNFKTYSAKGIPGLDVHPYNTSSIMHYFWNIFAKDATKPTINKKPCAATDASAGCRPTPGKVLATSDIAGVTRIVAADPANKFRLASAASAYAKCLTSPGYTDGAQVSLVTCNNTTQQKWFTFRRPGTTADMYINAYSRMCLAVAGNALMIQKSCNGSVGQTLVLDGKRLRQGGKCVEALSSGAARSVTCPLSNPLLLPALSFDWSKK